MIKTKICKYCKKKFKTTTNTSRFCSVDCRMLSHKKKIIKFCKWCGKKYNLSNKQFYCSDKCYNEHYNYYQREYQRKYVRQPKVKKIRQQYYIDHKSEFQARHIKYYKKHKNGKSTVVKTAV